MAKMTAAQTTAELERKASLGIKPTDSKNNAQYNAIVNRVNSSSNSSSSSSSNTYYPSNSSSSSSSSSNTYKPPTPTPVKMPSISYGKDATGYYKQSGTNKTYVTSANKQYFPSNYGGVSDWKYNEPTTTTTNSNGYKTDYLNSEYGKLANDLSYEGLKTYNQKLSEMKGADVRSYANDEYALRMWEIANNRVNSNVNGSLWTDPQYANTMKRYDNDISEQDSVADYVFNMLGADKINALSGLNDAQIETQLKSYGLKGVTPDAIKKKLENYNNGMRPTSNQDAYMDWLKETNLQGTPQLERIFRENYALKEDGTIGLVDGLTDLNGLPVHNNMYVKYGDDLATMFGNIKNNEVKYGQDQNISDAANNMLSSSIANRVNGANGISSNGTASLPSGYTQQNGIITDANGQIYGSNEMLYGNKNSTHIIGASGQLDPNDKRMTVDQYGNWVSDQYGQDAKGTYVIKGGDTNNKVYMNESNKQYFASNVGGTGNFMYDANNKTTYDSKTQAMRTDKDYNTLGDVNKFSPNKTQEYVDYGKKYEGMTVEQLQQAKQSASLLERNFISSIDDTMLKDGKFQGVAPIAFAPENMQENLANYVYNDMRKEGMDAWQGVSTKAIDEMLNQSGLGGMVDVNKVNVPYIIEQQLKAQAQANGDSARLDIDPKAILDEIVANGGLKRGYMYDDKTGNITVDPKYTQMGDVLADKGEAIRWYGNEEQWFDQRTRNETVTGNTAETPLELRARYQPETMTEEMQADLVQEREIKTQLEQLTLQLQEIEQLTGGSGGGLVLNSGGLGAGSGGTGGTGSGNGSASSYGLYGAGGDSSFNTVTGGGKGAVYGTSQNYTNANSNLLNALSRRLG